MPGSTEAVRLSVSTSSNRFKCLLVSMTSAAPTVWPHCDVPAPRGKMGTPARHGGLGGANGLVGRARDDDAERLDLVDRRIRRIAAAIPGVE